MGRASTFFNTMRQVGSATGVAVLSTVLIGVGSTQGSGGHVCARHHGATISPSSRRRCSPWSAAAFSLTIHDSDAAETIVRRRGVRGCAATPCSTVPEGSPA